MWTDDKEDDNEFVCPLSQDQMVIEIGCNTDIGLSCVMLRCRFDGSMLPRGLTSVSNDRSRRAILKLALTRLMWGILSCSVCEKECITWIMVLSALPFELHWNHNSGSE